MLDFYGISVPVLVHMNTTKKRRRVLVKLISLANNESLTTTSRTALYLKECITGFKYSYSDPRIVSLERKLRTMNSGLNSFSTGKETPEEIQSQIDKLVSELGSEKVLVNSFINVDGEKIVLGDKEFEFLSLLVGAMPTKLDDLINSCSETIVMGGKVFGRVPSQVIAKPHLMESSFYKSISLYKGKPIPPEVIRRLQAHIEDSENIITAIESEDTTQDVTQKDIEQAFSNTNFVSYLDSMGIDSSDKDKLDVIYTNYLPYLSTSVQLFAGFLNEAELKELSLFYFELFLVDNSESYLNRMFGTNGYTLDDFDYCFKAMNDIGLFLFTRTNVISFIDKIRVLVIGKDKNKISITDNLTNNGKNFKEVLLDLKYALYSLNPSGSRREE